ncbi:hypothetical protein KL911_000775 [Ogataea haglerorum]|uniref:uncharacterized protein n=1 Tax=Ogataea haglerorum TaxID=1937702 RepID=UPI001C89A6B6|nr:uncharacterized protein KL911_000775 [Ogataea haglerorum]KAG7750367.1 hypothetical protein KL912_000927 [Ogataea haglerorum]KAG7757799.1 hypothetical protein KL911_000775 [Ogataea haglerorum]KAG7771284.1 hypothetical protein KL931_000982 [Ogataea haglerorum]KAG7787026.1 hypothetical protein KL910_003688 [Ogataea haglerorum]KAG7788731.1 hypothetical protein KL945_002170 [Ogataea haglerorum]
MSSSEEETPLNAVKRKRVTKRPEPILSESEDGLATGSEKVKTPTTSFSEDETDDVPLKKRKTNSKAAQSRPTVKKETQSSVSVSPRKKSQKSKEPKIKKEETPKVKTEDEAEEEERYKWWEQQDLNDEIVWDTLEHNGVIFPPEYEPLPSHVKLIYDKKPVSLPPAAEEVAGFYAALLESDHAKNPTFQKNFFADFLEVLKENGGCPDAEIKEFEKCDFSKMFEYFQKQKEEKKAISPQEKKRIKQEKEKMEEKYKFCLLNGRKEQVGNFRVEPPGLFRGRGAHPKTGKLKKRVQPEDITLNLSKDAPIPPPPEGHQWGEIKHDNTVAWLAMWRENVLGSVKYVRFAQNSSLKGMSDFKKFEKARELKNCIDAIRKDYRAKLKSELMMDRQLATATYLIDVFALRAGGEKSEDEADTVGCCSLRYEHIFLKPPNTVVFDFLGKDSIRFYQEVEVDPQVFKNLRIFKKSPKKPGDNLFDRIDPSVLNKYFQSYLPGLTAKVFRTYNASKTMQDQIDLIKNEGTVNEKVVKFNAANRTVAILCNHQRTVSKNHEAGVQKINEKIEEMIWRKIVLKRMMLQQDESLRNKDSKYFEEIDDLSKEEEQKIIERVLQKEREKIEKRYERELLKLGYEELTKDEKTKKKDELAADRKSRLEKHKELEKTYRNEFKSRKYEIKSTQTVEKLQQQVEKIETRIKNTSLQLKDKEDNSQVALNTSKINYIDPRLTVMFSKKFEVPIEKLFTKTLREKFAWAIESADENWRF